MSTDPLFVKRPVIQAGIHYGHIMQRSLTKMFAAPRGVPLRLFRTYGEAWKYVRANGLPQPSPYPRRPGALRRTYSEKFDASTIGGTPAAACLVGWLKEHCEKPRPYLSFLTQQFALYSAAASVSSPFHRSQIIAIVHREIRLKLSRFMEVHEGGELIKRWLDCILSARYRQHQRAINVEATVARRQHKAWQVEQTKIDVQRKTARDGA